jgi:hypothetical protein
VLLARVQKPEIGDAIEALAPTSFRKSRRTMKKHGAGRFHNGHEELTGTLRFEPIGAIAGRVQYRMISIVTGYVPVVL